MDSNLLRIKNRVASIENTVEQQLPCILEMQQALISAVEKLQDELEGLKANAKPKRQRNTANSNQSKK